MSGIDWKLSVDNGDALKRIREVKDTARKAIKGINGEFDSIDDAIKASSELMNTNWKNIISLQKEADKATSAMSGLPRNTKQWAVLNKELTKIKEDLKAERDNLSQNASELAKYRQALDDNKNAYISVRTQMTNVRNEMAELEMAGQKNSERYRELQSEIGRLGTAYRKIQYEQKALSTGATQWAGIQSGIQGVMGAFAAGQGVMGLFADKSEELVKIQTRLQSVMAIIMGMTQVSNTLHATSAFRMTTMTKVTELWHSANLKLAKGLLRLGASADTARVASVALNGALTLGIGAAIGIAIGLISKLIEKHKESQRAAEESAKAQREASSKYAESVASHSSRTIVKFQSLRTEYERLGNSLEKKKKFIEDNTGAFKELGVKITGINEADNLFINNADAFIASVNARARAAAAMDIASEKYKASIEKMIEAENVGGEELKITRSSSGLYVGEGLDEKQNKELNKTIIEARNRRYEMMRGFGPRLPEGVSVSDAIDKAGEEAGKKYINGIKEGIEAEAKQLEKEANEAIQLSLKLGNETKSILSGAGIKETDRTSQDTDTEDREILQRQKRLAQLVLDNDRALARSRLEVMEEGREKELASVDQWLAEQLEAIDKARSQMLELKGLKPTDRLDDETEEKFSERRNNATQTADRKKEDINKGYDKKEAEMYSSLLSKYADYDQKRREIDERYEEDRKALQEKYDSTGDERFSSALTVLQGKHQQEINSLEMAYDRVYQQIFRDPAKMAKSTIVATIELAKEKLDELYRTGEDGKLVDPESVKLLQDAIDNLENAADDMSLKGWSDNYDGIIKKTRTISRIEAEIQKAKKTGDKSALDDAESRLQATKEQLKNNLAGTGVQVFSYSLQSAAGYMKQIADLTGDIELGETADVLSGIAQNFAAAGQGAASGGWIGAVVAGVSDAIGQITNYFAESNAAAAEASKAMEDYAQAIKMLALNVDEDDYNTIFGMNSWGLMTDRWKKSQEALAEFQKASQREWEWAYRYTGETEVGLNAQTAASGGQVIERKNGQIKWKVQRTTQEALGNEYIRSKGSKKKRTEGTLSELFPDLFDENGQLRADKIDEAKAALETLNSMKLKEGAEARDRLEKAIAYAEEYDKLMQEVRASVRDTLGDWGAQLGDAVVDNILRGTDAMETFKKVSSDTIISIAKQAATSFIFDKYLDSFSDDLTKAFGEGDTDKITSIIAEIGKGLPGIIEQAGEMTKAIFDNAEAQGLYVKDTLAAQEASARGFNAMSQDTGDELNGRFTDIQGKVTLIRDITLQMVADGKQRLDQIVNIRDIMIQLNGNVADIKIYTQVLPEMGETLLSINRKLDSI